MSARKPVTEEEWITSRLVAPLLRCVRECRCGSNRKFRLFAVACCRRVWPLLTDERLQAAVLVGERVAEGEAPESELSPALDAGGDAVGKICEATGRNYSHEIRRAPFAYDRGGPAVLRWGIAAACCATELPDRAASIAEAVANKKELAVNSGLFRCLFGNPFRPMSFSPSWRTDTALALARQMYESRDFGAMPILADALQDAGCNNEDLLAHCRDANQLHARGCWVVDAVLEKG